MGHMKLNLIRILYELRHKQSERKELCRRIYFFVIFGHEMFLIEVKERKTSEDEERNVENEMKRSKLITWSWLHRERDKNRVKAFCWNETMRPRKEKNRRSDFAQIQRKKLLSAYFPKFRFSCVMFLQNF